MSAYENTRSAAYWSTLLSRVNRILWSGIGVCFLVSMILGSRPAVIVHNETGQTWDKVYRRVCWGPGGKGGNDTDVPPGGVFNVRRFDCSMGSVDNLLPWEYVASTWGVAVQYPGETEPVELVYFLSEGGTPWLRFWDIDLIRVVVHEGNRVEIGWRWW